MSEYDDMSIDELIEYPARTAATASKIGRELGRRRLIRDTYLDISEAMAEAGEIVVPQATMRNMAEALYYAETVMMMVEPRSNKAEYLCCLKQVCASLSLANEARVKP